jgi:hypothetical protein
VPVDQLALWCDFDGLSTDGLLPIVDLSRALLAGGSLPSSMIAALTDSTTADAILA